MTATQRLWSAGSPGHTLRATEAEMSNNGQYMSRLGLDARELASRRLYFQIGEEDLARLAALRPFAEKHNDAIVEAFYDELLLKHDESRRFFSDPAVLRRAAEAQKRYFLQLFSGRCDLAYLEDRLRVGSTHQRLNVAPKWYLGVYAHYLRLITHRLFEERGESVQTDAEYKAIQKIVFFDMSLAIETYIAAGVETIERHQEAIRELSTPVIQLYDKVLLLPLVGTVDPVRARQMVERVLEQVVKAQARVIILDIAGVAVVDTAVANHLLQTTEAVRLLGATSILTGIRPQVAQTLVQLGVDLSSMHTCASLQEGLELALDLTGRVIRARGR